MKRIACLFIALLSISILFASCDKEPPRLRETESTTASDLQDNPYPNLNTQNNTFTLSKVIEMFTKYASYDAKYDIYHFSKVDNSLGNVMMNFKFIYHPSSKLFTASLSTHTYTAYEMIDYGAATFAWNDVQNAYCTGYHQLVNVANINFTFSGSQLGDDLRLTDKFTYQVKENTFVNLKDSSEIRSYAKTCFECVQFGLGYAQTILFQYLGSSYTLW